MTRTSASALAVTRPIILGLTILNLLYALGITALFAGSFVMADWPMKQLGYDLATMDPQLPAGIRAIEILGLVGAALVHMVLRRLLRIVDSVRDGDPFILDNAGRLQAIAWCVLGNELLRLMVWAISVLVDMKMQMVGFSFAPWLAVLLLFVLAGVFTRGARMRADLEGTV